MNFTAKDVQMLRERTGVGMMDCKKALAASDGDTEKAIQFLRVKGIAAAAKKSGRIAAALPKPISIAISRMRSFSSLRQSADFDNLRRLI